MQVLHFGTYLSSNGHASIPDYERCALRHHLVGGADCTTSTPLSQRFHSDLTSQGQDGHANLMEEQDGGDFCKYGIYFANSKIGQFKCLKGKMEDKKVLKTFLANGAIHLPLLETNCLICNWKLFPRLEHLHLKSDDAFKSDLWKLSLKRIRLYDSQGVLNCLDDLPNLECVLNISMSLSTSSNFSLLVLWPSTENIETSRFLSNSDAGCRILSEFRIRQN